MVTSLQIPQGGIGRSILTSLLTGTGGLVFTATVDGAVAPCCTFCRLVERGRTAESSVDPALILDLEHFFFCVVPFPPW